MATKIYNIFLLLSEMLICLHNKFDVNQKCYSTFSYVYPTTLYCIITLSYLTYDFDCDDQIHDLLVIVVDYYTLADDESLQVDGVPREVQQ